MVDVMAQQVERNHFFFSSGEKARSLLLLFLMSCAAVKALPSKRGGGTRASTLHCRIPGFA